MGYLTKENKEKTRVRISPGSQSKTFLDNQLIIRDLILIPKGLEPLVNKLLII